MMAGAIEWILDKQQQWAAAETTEEGKKAQRRYQDTVLALSTAYALASATDEARAVREEVGFSRPSASPGKSATGSSSQERDLAIRQIVSRAVISTEIVDILGRRHPVSGHLHPVRRVPCRSAADGEESGAGGFAQSSSTMVIRSRSKSNRADQGILHTAGGIYCALPR